MCNTEEEKNKTKAAFKSGLKGFSISKAMSQPVYAFIIYTCNPVHGLRQLESISSTSALR